MEYDPVDRLILDYGELLVAIITVFRVPECVWCELDEVRDST